MKWRGGQEGGNNREEGEERRVYKGRGEGRRERREPEEGE